MRRTRVYGSPGLLRSLTLLRAFLLASAAILAAGALALSSTLSADLRAAALEDTAHDMDGFANAVLAPALVRGDRVVATPATLRRLERSIRIPADIRSVNVYTRTGRLVFSTANRGRVGRRLSSSDLRAAVQSGDARAEVVDPVGEAPPVVKSWIPLRTEAGASVGAAEISLHEDVVADTLAGSRWTVWYAVAIVFGLLWFALALFVRGASRRLRAQREALEARSHELLESARELEATLLETIETLNAAVEARDPYTAGHAQRVRRVALAIGRELRLPVRQLGALGTAALFHDIGKIGMPDAILTKPDRLTRAEAAVMREHVTRGAEIVARISSLAACVPAIRHHHERWDGLGYPDRLRGTDIPIEAAIIAIADAWDAMTTDRPYAAALPMDEALRQIEAGRGKQFNPAVVDAFQSVSRRRPAEVMPPGAQSAAHAEAV